MKISQEDGARLMFLHHKVVVAEAQVGRAVRISEDRFNQRCAERDAAEQAFAELVASLTESEGL